MKKIYFVDFEASSLGNESYPIEIAWGSPMDGEIKSSLILPKSSWVDWNPESEKIHGISKDQLYREGKPVEEVCDRVWTDLENSICFSDASSFDQYWMIRLFENRSICPVVKNWRWLFASLLKTEADLNIKIDICCHRARAISPPTHRASDDVRYFLEVYNQVLLESKNQK